VDTRRKVLTAAAALPPDAAAPVAVATGYFDILRAAHARQLADVRRSTGAGTLIVLVLPLAGELLDRHVRARMVAALRVVDYVVSAENEEANRILERWQPAAVVRLEAADALERRRLIGHAQHKNERP